MILLCRQMDSVLFLNRQVPSFLPDGDPQAFHLGICRGDWTFFFQNLGFNRCLSNLESEFVWVDNCLCKLL